MICEAGRVLVERDTLYRPVERTQDNLTVAVQKCFAAPALSFFSSPHRRLGIRPEEREG
jgi:hypothetical protein